MSCPGCFASEKEKERLRSSIFNEAKTYARKHEKTVIIYQNEMGEFAYMEREAAQALNINGSIVSHL